MKLTLLSALLLLASLSFPAQAQDKAAQKGRNSIQMMLRNGSTVTGNVIYISPDGKMVEMQTETGSQPVWFNEVITVRRDRGDKKWKKRPDPWAFRMRYDPLWKDPSHWEFGFYGDYGFGVGKHGMDRYEVGLNLRYGINEYLFVGGGAGVNSIRNFGTTGCAVFANLRGYMRNHGVRPFGDVRIGYNFRTDSYVDELARTLHDQGLTLRFGVGIAVVDRSNIGYSFSVGYQMQSIKLMKPNEDAFRQMSGSLALQLGITFRW